jgi:hypothetical protein
MQLDETGGLIKVDASTAVRPLIWDTWLLKLVEGLFRRLFRKDETAEEADESDSEDASASEISSSGNQNTGMRGRRVASKAGGMRRKAVRDRRR